MLIDDRNLELVAKGFKAIYHEHFDATVSHKDTLAMTTESGSAEENYGWLGQFPDLREWIGDRQVHELTSHGFAIKNRKFESTVKVKRDDISDDRFGVYKPLFSEMGRVSKQHPDRMIFEVMANGFSLACYDGQSFFDAEHGLYNGSGEVIGSVSNMQAGSGPAWFLLDLGKAIKPFIWQEREKYEFQSLDDLRSERVFFRDEFTFGIRARVNAGIGLWQLAFGSKAPLTVENYTAARATMSAYAGDRGQKLGITPTHLVVPSDLETNGRNILLADQINGSSNIWKGTADLIVTPWL